MTAAPLVTLDVATIPDDYESLLHAGRLLAELDTRNRFALGWLGLRVDKRYGETAIKQYARDIGMAYKTLYSYMAVVEVYGQSSPAENIPLNWTHYREAARLKSRALANRVLDKAAGRMWTAERCGVFVSRYLSFTGQRERRPADKTGEPVTRFTDTFTGGTMVIPPECALALQTGKRYQVAFYEAESEAV